MYVTAKSSEMIHVALNLPTMVMLTVALCPVPTLLIGTQVYTPSVSTVMLSTPELLLLIKESLR